MTVRRRPGIWRKLMLLIGGTVLVMWLALALTSLTFARFQTEFAGLATSQVPRVAQAGELAALSGRLTTLATRIIGGETASDGLIADIEAVSGQLQGRLALLRPSGADLPDIADLQQRIAALVPIGQRRQGESMALARDIEALRWLNVDIQNEVEPLLGDYDFNIRARMPDLANDMDPTERQRVMDLIATDRTLRDQVLQIGAEAGTVATLLLQAAVAGEDRQVTQLADQSYDLLSQLAARIEFLPDRPEFLTLRQSVDRLREHADMPDGLIARRRAMLDLQTRALIEIQAVQTGLSSLQDYLATLAQAESSNVQQSIAKGVDRGRLTLTALALLTLALAAGGLALVFGVMRRRIVAPLRDLTSRLLLLSERSSPRHDIPAPKGRDEIERLRHAVDDFATTISARDQAITTLRATQADLVQAGKMAALGNLSAGISHELNQPLAALRYRLVLLDDARRMGDEVNVGRQLDRIADLSERMQAIISHLGRFARRSDSKRETVVLADPVANAISLLQNRLDAAGVTPQVLPRVAQTSASGVPVLIEQVVLNLLANALDAVAETGGLIEVDTECHGARVDLIVRDTGIGLGALSPEEAMNPFVTSKEAGRGTGLGLSISYNIARDMGGDLKLSPAKGGGVVARLTLAAAEDA